MRETFVLLFDRKKYTEAELWDEENGYGGDFDSFIVDDYEGVRVYELTDFYTEFNDRRTIDSKKELIMIWEFGKDD